MSGDDGQPYDYLGIEPATQYDSMQAIQPTPGLPLNPRDLTAAPIATMSSGQPLDTLLDTARSTFVPSSSPHQVRNPNQGSAEGRLALLAQVGSQHSAPLRPLAFQPAHWENADHTRPPSPSREDESSGHDFWQSMDVRPSLSDDPVTLELVDPTTAEQLVNLCVLYD